MKKDSEAVFSSDITIVVYGEYAQTFCDELNNSYAAIEEVGIINFLQLNEDNNSDLFILVGNIDEVDVEELPSSAKYIDITDKKIAHLLNQERDINILRKQIIVGLVAPYLGSLIGVDISEIVNILDNSKKLHIGLANSQGVSDCQDLIRNVIARSGANMSRCKSVYMSISGDIDMMQGNEIANSLQEVAGEDKNIVWSMVYNDKMENKYYVMALFGE